MLRQTIRQMLEEEALAADKKELPLPTGLKDNVAGPCCETVSRIRPDFKGTILAP